MYDYINVIKMEFLGKMKDLYVYRVKFGSKRVKKIKLKKFLKAINFECYTKKFFISEKEAKEYIK